MNPISIIPEDYDDDDYQPQYAYPQNNSLPDSMYEDKSKIQAAGLRQTPLSQIGGKKRYRPPTVLGPPSGQFGKNGRSPSMASFNSTSSGDRSSIYPGPNYQQHYHQQQYQQYPQYQQHPPHPQQQGYYAAPQQFQPPMHYSAQQRSGSSLLSPASSNIHLHQPPRRFNGNNNMSSESLTPSNSFEQGNQLPISPESMEELNNKKHDSIVLELNNKNDSLTKENGELNAKILTLEKLLNDKEQELQLKNSIIDAKSKQLNLREEKLNNKEKQIEILNKKIATPAIQDTGNEVILKESNKNLTFKVNSLSKQLEQLKTSEHDKLVKANEDLSAQVATLLKEMDALKAEKQPATKLTSEIPQSPRFAISGNKTIKDLTKEELFKLEFLKILDVLNQNQFYYENKIKILQDSVEDHKQMVKNISHTKKSSVNQKDAKKGLKVINIVPSTL